MIPATDKCSTCDGSGEQWRACEEDRCVERGAHSHWQHCLCCDDGYVVPACDECGESAVLSVWGVAMCAGCLVMGAAEARAA